jgi:pyruvyltransferase
MPRTIKTYWWDEEPNFGDAMNPLFLDRLFGVNVEWAPLDLAQLTASGSVIQWITPKVPARSEPIYVWGSGYIFPGEPAPPSGSANYCAVRGKQSAAMSGLGQDVVLGDPGLLANLVVPPPSRKRHAVGVVPHLHHRSDPVLLAAIRKSDALFIDVGADPADVLAQIASCEFVFSSSLHGLIVADSYGVPNTWLTLEPPPFGGEWKFRDYYSIFGAAAAPTPVEPGLDLLAIVKRDRDSYSRPGIEARKQALLAAFPFQ